MNLTPSDDSAASSPTSELSFKALKWHLEWWIFPEAKTLRDITDRTDLITARALPIGSPPVNWSFLDWPDVTRFRVFGLSSQFREELKATLRKRSHVKGNIKHLFFQQGDLSIPFEPFVVPYSDRSIAIYFRTSSLTFPVYSSDLVRLSSHPSLRLSQLRMAVEKICTVLRTGDISARRSSAISYRWYPYIHIMDYVPKPHFYGGTIDIPWRDLVPIGTRHTKISSSDHPLIESFKAKNHSIRGGVLVIDKQSTLVVSEEEYLELRGIRYCLAVALRMRQILEREFRGSHEAVPLAAPLLQRLRFAYERPSVITDSQTYRTLWPLIAHECQVIEWLSNLEQKSKVEAVSLLQTGRLASAKAFSGSTQGSSEVSGASEKAIEWLHLSDFHFQSNSNQSRERVLKALCHDLEKILETGEWKPDFIAVTGDLSFSGKSEQFKRAWDFLKQILAICALKKEYLFVVPGNHDVSRAAHQPALLKALRDAQNPQEYDKVCEELGDQHVQGLLTRRLAAYREFLKKLPRRRSLSDDKLWFVDKVIEREGATAAIAGLTSSWASVFSNPKMSLKRE